MTLQQQRRPRGRPATTKADYQQTAGDERLLTDYNKGQAADSLPRTDRLTLHRGRQLKHSSRCDELPSRLVSLNLKHAGSLDTREGASASPRE